MKRSKPVTNAHLSDQIRRIRSGKWKQRKLHLFIHAIAVAGLASNTAIAEPAKAAPQQWTGSAVEITAEPLHKVRFDNGRVRLIELIIPKGKTTLYHTHRHDGFFIFCGAAHVGFQKLGEQPLVVSMQPGSRNFTPAENGPYTHRVFSAKDEDICVSALELIGSPAVKLASTADDRFPPFEILINNQRGRLYRLRLGPGEVTETFTRPASTAVIAVSSGRISEQAKGKTSRLWDFEPGSFRWIEAGEELSIRNAGSTPLELIEIEVF
jgi:mannose-6-phosphate isomerase-like protein (cupin superfamily)